MEEARALGTQHGWDPPTPSLRNYKELKMEVLEASALPCGNKGLQLGHYPSQPQSHLRKATLETLNNNQRK